jgi:hypothetical protein
MTQSEAVGIRDLRPGIIYAGFLALSSVGVVAIHEARAESQYARVAAQSCETLVRSYPTSSLFGIIADYAVDTPRRSIIPSFPQLTLARAGETLP